ncbi:hypothetical protein M758_7G022000 [Ceratodon purpureus]|nr:hypothetical protein M758_7G022000 [Ceratodon purpureus]
MQKLTTMHRATVPKLLLLLLLRYIASKPKTSGVRHHSAPHSLNRVLHIPKHALPRH